MIIFLLISFWGLSQASPFTDAIDRARIDPGVADRSCAEVFLFDDQLSIYFDKEYLYIKPVDLLQGQAFAVSVMEMNGTLIGTLTWQLNEQGGKVLYLGKEGLPLREIRLQLEVGHMALNARIRN